MGLAGKGDGTDNVIMLNSMKAFAGMSIPHLPKT